jgi:hypothetical protein
VAAPIPPNIHRYLDALLTLAGLTPIRLPEHEQMLQELFHRLNSFTLQAYINNLAPVSRAIFEQRVAEQRSPLELEQFIHDHGGDLATVHADALRAFRRLYLLEVAASRRSKS